MMILAVFAPAVLVRFQERRISGLQDPDARIEVLDARGVSRDRGAIEADDLGRGMNMSGPFFFRKKAYRPEGDLSDVCDDEPDQWSAQINMRRIRGRDPADGLECFENHN
ncbi:MAG: hypothetical protein IMZ57_11100 [Acidobacteria bacterium]|nr:hypothetical protein [Acidobacteriota bacterium]